MKLQLLNVGKIEYAAIKLDGITVIAGENNTGKSTIGRIVFSLFNSLVNIEEKIARQKEQLIVQFLYRKIDEMPTNTEEIIYHERISMVRLRNFAKNLCEVESDEEYKRLLNNLLKNKEFINVEEMIEEIKKIKCLPVERLAKSAVSNYYNRIFNSQINNHFNDGEKAIIDAEIKDKTVKICFAENACCELEQQLSIQNEAIYLDNPFILDYLNKGSLGSNEIEAITVRKLRMSVDAVEDVVQYSLIADKIKGIIEKINEVTDGSLWMDETQSFFYREKDGKNFNVNNLSAGLKSFVIIKTLLEKGALKEKDALILDEPEIHLHPAWQLVYAEVIVLLQKTFGLTILITTHSAHFLEALNYFALKYKMNNNCNFYLSKATENGCSLEDVTDDLSKIYSQLVDPSILLDKLKYQMEDEDNE